MSINETIALLKKNCVELVNEEELAKKLASGKTLRVKLGADPTSPDLHLGHSVVLYKMRQFQDLGHTGVLVIGDFTASIGDPSGRDSTRPVLGMDAIRHNAETYKKQAFKILDPEKTEVRFNSEWLLPFAGIPAGSENLGGRASALLTSLSRITISQLLEREDFRNRMKEGSPISMLELLYPIFQGYDSVALKADVELGGADQIFNLLVGRDLQRENGQDPQVVMTMPLLIGTDGTRKMSKSYGNYVGLMDEPFDMFGKLMSMSDSLMWDYYSMFTNEDIPSLKAGHPMQAKKKLAHMMVARLHSSQAADEALKKFEQVFSKKEYPEDMPVFAPADGERLSKVLLSAGLAPSMNEARRLITQGAVKLNGQKLAADAAVEFSGEAVLQVGSRRFCKLVRK